MRREQVELGWDGPRGTVIAYGHFGRPVIVFPAEAGRAWDPEDNGLVGAVADLVDAGRVKLYCVDSFDAWTWSDRDAPLEERAQRHGAYESWILDHVVPWASADSGGAGEFVTNAVEGRKDARLLARAEPDARVFNVHDGEVTLSLEPHSYLFLARAVLHGVVE